MVDVMGLVLLSIGLIGTIMLAMAVGTLVTGRCLRGSCGGLQPGKDGEDMSCDTCPMRRQRSHGTSVPNEEPQSIRTRSR